MWPWVGVSYLILLLSAFWTVPVSADRLVDDFESSDVSWNLTSSDCNVQVLGHHRISQDAHSGLQSEGISVHADRGTYIFLSHAIGPARAITELKLAVWIKSDRTGLQLLARVVYPRTLDPQTRKPIVVWVRGTSYVKVGRWEQLQLDRIPTLIARQTRMLRSRLGPQVDERESYIDRAVINIYGGPGATTVMIDDLSASHLVKKNLADAKNHSQHIDARSTNSHIQPAQFLESSQAQSDDLVHLEGSILETDGQPVFPRLVQHQGESFETIAALGFSGIILPSAATDSQLRNASRLGLWLVAPPPDLHKVDTMGPQYSCVLAWDLGHRLGSRDIDATRRMADQVRRADPVSARPLVCNALDNRLRFSRYADILLVGRDTFYTSLELPDYLVWLEQQRRVTRHRTPLWAAMQTERSAELASQLTILRGDHTTTDPVDIQQLRLFSYSLVASGVRGICFASNTPLSAPNTDDPRALALAALNIELQLFEPWAAAGQRIATIQTNDPQVKVAVIALARSRLLLPLRMLHGSQYCVGAPAIEKLSFVVPGVPSSHEAYHITSSKLEPLRHRRVTGGRQIVLNNFRLVDAIVLTQDPLVVQRLSRQLSVNQKRISQLNHDLASTIFHGTDTTISLIAARGGTPPRGDTWMREARNSLVQCQQLFRTHSYHDANQQAIKTIGLLGQVRRAYWDLAAGRFRWPTASPALVDFDTLPFHWNLSQQLQRFVAGPNMLPSGNFESLNHMLDQGWDHLRVEQPGIRTDVELTPNDRKTGNYALRLRAWPTDPSAPVDVVETAPISITSAKVRAEPGQLVRISGWVKVPTVLVGSPDGLVVADSAGGRSLGLQIRQTDDWQEFVLYRTVDERGELVVNLQLHGLGEALVDAMSVIPYQLNSKSQVRRDQARRLREFFGKPR